MPSTSETRGELWLRPHPWTPLAEFIELIKNRRLAATPRLGIRDGNHPKGYAIGQPVNLKLFDGAGRPLLITPVEITGLLIRPIAKLVADDLGDCEPSSRSWLDVHKILSFFEQRELHPREWATVVRFTYPTEETLW